MRINFDLPFKELEKLLDVGPDRGAKQVRSTGFSQLLSEIAPNTQQNIEITQDSPPEKIPVAPREMTMRAAELEDRQGYKFSSPVQRQDFAADRLLPEGLIIGELPVNNPTSAVPLTPKVVSVKRIPSATEMAALPAFERLAVTKELVLDAGKRHGVDPVLGLAVAAAESSFNPLAVSKDGFESKGLFQLLDSTGTELHARAGHQHDYNPYSPELNVDLGMSYLRRLHDLFSADNQVTSRSSTVAAANSSNLEKLAVAAFNAGEGRVASAQMRANKAGKDPANYDSVEPYLPEITQQYVKRVFNYRSEFEGHFES